MHIFGAINQAMFDWPWSGIHFTVGTIFGLVFTWVGLTKKSKRFWSTTVSLLVIWEIYERVMHFLDVYHHQAIAVYKATVMGFAFAPETTINSIGDLVIGSLGLWLGRWIVLRLLPPKAT